MSANVKGAQLHPQCLATRCLHKSPLAWPLNSKVQNRRRPVRCQATTVSGLTMTRAERQSLQRRDSQPHNRQSAGVNFGRFLAERCSTATGWRRARFSRAQAPHENATLKTECQGVSQET